MARKAGGRLVEPSSRDVQYSWFPFHQGTGPPKPCLLVLQRVALRFGCQFQGLFSLIDMARWIWLFGIREDREVF